MAALLYPGFTTFIIQQFSCQRKTDISPEESRLSVLDRGHLSLDGKARPRLAREGKLIDKPPVESIKFRGQSAKLTKEDQ
jgi:hypothetical protein